MRKCIWCSRLVAHYYPSTPIATAISMGHVTYIKIIVCDLHGRNSQQMLKLCTDVMEPNEFFRGQNLIASLPYCCPHNAFRHIGTIANYRKQWRSQDLVSGGAQPNFPLLFSFPPPSFSSLPSSLLPFMYPLSLPLPCRFPVPSLPPPLLNSARVSGAAR